MNKRATPFLLFFMISGFALPQFILAESANVDIVALVPGCGDEVIQSGEQCDGANLDGASCILRGFGGGSLSCTASCIFNTSLCSSVSSSGESGGGGGGGSGGQSVNMFSPIISGLSTVINNVINNIMNNQIIKPSVPKPKSSNLNNSQAKIVPPLFDIIIKPVQPQSSNGNARSFFTSFKSSFSKFIFNIFNRLNFSKK